MDMIDIPLGPKAKIAGLLVAGIDSLVDTSIKHPGKNLGKKLLETVNPAIVLNEMRKKLPRIEVKDICRRFSDLKLFESGLPKETINWASWAQFSIIGCLGLPNDCGEIGLISTTTIRTFNVILAQSSKKEGETLGIEVLFIHPPQGAVLLKTPETERGELSTQFIEFLKQECWMDIDRYLNVTNDENKSGRIGGIGSMTTILSNVHGTQRILATPF